MNQYNNDESFISVIALLIDSFIHLFIGSFMSEKINESINE